MLVVPIEVVEHTTHELFQKTRTRLARYGPTQTYDVTLSSEEVTDSMLAELLRVGVEDASFVQDVQQIIDARAGIFKPIRSRNALSEVLLAYVGVNFMQGAWVYQDTGHGYHQPHEVTDVLLSPRTGEFFLVGEAALTLRNSEKHQIDTRAFYEEPMISYARRRPETLLANAGLYKETPELRNQYRADLQRLSVVMEIGNRVDVRAKAFTGVGRYENAQELKLSKPLQCVTDSEVATVITEPITEESEYLPLVNLMVPVFDLWGGQMVAAYVGDVTQHVWRDDAVEKLVLPEAQKRVLELAVGPDSAGFGGDFVDDKTPGNILLCKGEPGIGKTLTAEAYAEFTHSALYPVDMNILATESDVSATLQLILSRARRWNAFILLDEADVVVAKRGDDVKKNAIVAEVLKAVERYERPIFMTTNRPDDIDEAVISRCLMILHYEVPKAEASVAAWHALSSSYKVKLEDATVERFVSEIGSIAPREIGQIIRLAARMAARDKTTVTFEHLEESATMRGLNRGVAKA
jgi:hypothetical protein